MSRWWNHVTRPEALERDFGETAKKRANLLPGITGLWQVSGRSDVSSEQRFAWDLYYIEHWSLGMDLEIIDAAPLIERQGDALDRRSPSDETAADLIDRLTARLGERRAESFAIADASRVSFGQRTREPLDLCAEGEAP